MQDADAIAVLTAKVNELARVCAQLSQDNAELRGRVSALSARAVPVADTTVSDAQYGTRDVGGPAAPTTAPRISRRTIGVALAGAAAGLVGGTALAERSARPAAPAAETGAAAELTAAEQLTAAAPTSTGSVVNASLSTASPVLAGNNASTGPGVYGGNNSTGAGVSGVNNNAGTGVSGLNTSTGVGVSAANTGSGPGVRASSSHGRGGIFAGAAAAQIQLTPGGSSHPTSGQRGDLYADSSGRLWYCKTTGTTATWHQIA